LAEAELPMTFLIDASSGINEAGKEFEDDAD